MMLVLTQFSTGRSTPGGIVYLTGLMGVPSSPWKNSFRRSDELMRTSGEHIMSSAATDGIDFSNNFDRAVGFSMSS